MTDTMEAVARAIEEAEEAWLLQEGDAQDGLQEHPPHSLPETIARAVTATLMKRMREPLQQELEHLYVLEAESISLAPNSYGAGNASGRREGMKEAMDALDQFEKETLGHD